MTELQYLIKGRGLTPKKLLGVTRRGLGATILGGLTGAALSSSGTARSIEAAGGDFTLAIIPDPQYLAENCPDNSGRYYAAVMNWIVENRNILLTSSRPSFRANIKAVIGVGDCVNSTGGKNEFRNCEAAWTILDDHGIAFTTPPGNHDYSGVLSHRSSLGAQFATGFFSARNRSSVYGSGIDLGAGDNACWVGSFDNSGANTAVKFVISGIRMLILAMDFFAGDEAWSWAYRTMLANPDCECYITTHAWLTSHGTQFQRTDAYGPDGYQMPGAPYSNCAVEAWNRVGVSTWSNLCGIFCGHDLIDSQNTATWYWKQVPIKSRSRRGQTVQQVFANSQQIDAQCSASINQASGSGQTASVFLLTRRPRLGLLEGRMISTHSGNWFGSRSESFPGGTSWSTREKLLFSVRFPGLTSLHPPARKPGRS